VPERWSGSWADNLALARMADAAGLEFLLPIGRWKGYGGTTNFQGATFEVLTWATAVLASTERITVFGTVHVPLVNPVAAAKALVTADHVGGGRVALNIVVGWNEDEFEMFGVAQRAETERYPYAQEWIDVVKRIWTDPDPFDFDGRFLQMKDVEGNPKILGGVCPLIMNAGASPAGRQYAIRNCDAFFTATERLPLAEVAAKVRAFKDEARAQDRDLDVFADCLVICRPTQREAEDYYRYALIENADWAAIDLRIDRRAGSGKEAGRAALTSEEFEARRNQMADSVGGRRVIGDPDAVARQLADLAGAGLRGMAMNFVNYLGELPYVRDEVFPRLERMGLRAPAYASAAAR
jgi:alkanesulfonate monooxygenase SsuD/methylene tetrahydromethanopterin reductase-like flavin-dependent oxidoreductase (luciferase family)